MKKKAMMVAALVACASAFADVAYVGSFDLSGATCGCGKRLKVDKSVDGNPLTVGGKTYAKGFGTHPESAILFRANGKVAAFDALVAIDDDAKRAGSGKSYGKPTARFKVWVDDRIVWSSGDLKLGQKPVPVHVDLVGAKEIILETARAIATNGLKDAGYIYVNIDDGFFWLPSPRSSASSRRLRRRSRASTAPTSGAFGQGTRSFSAWRLLVCVRSPSRRRACLQE